MCKLKSAIILKDSIFIPDYDSHTQMLEELGIKDTKANAEKLFIRAELYPANGDVFSPIENWVFKVDQDITPEWYVENYDKERMYNAVKKWAKDRIHIGVDGLKINAGANHFIKDCKNVEVCGSASIKFVSGSASINKVYDSASINEVSGSAIIAASPYGWNKKDKLIISDNATFKDNSTKTIWQSGDWTVKLVKDGEP